MVTHQTSDILMSLSHSTMPNKLENERFKEKEKHGQRI